MSAALVLPPVAQEIDPRTHRRCPSCGKANAIADLLDYVAVRAEMELMNAPRSLARMTTRIRFEARLVAAIAAGACPYGPCVIHEAKAMECEARAERTLARMEIERKAARKRRKAAK